MTNTARFATALDGPPEPPVPAAVLPAVVVVVVVPAAPPPALPAVPEVVVVVLEPALPAEPVTGVVLVPLLLSPQAVSASTPKATIPFSQLIFITCFLSTKTVPHESEYALARTAPWRDLAPRTMRSNLNVPRLAHCTTTHVQGWQQRSHP
jgi:hypothetical protein